MSSSSSSSLVTRPGTTSIAATVSSGALRFGQWPVAVEPHQPAVRQLPVDVLAHASGAMASSEHCRTSLGVRTRGRSARLSDRNVTRAKWRAISGSVRQKLLVSSSPSSGRSALPMITGAIALDQPR